MNAYKYVIQPGTFIPLPSKPEVAVAGCAAVVIAETRAQADALLDAKLAALGAEPWREVATVTEFTLDTAVVALVAQGM
jgi:type II secretory pathway predicted ATPase ExeA